MRQPREILNEIWERFRMSGIGDDLAIIEHLGCSLLDRNGKLSHSLYPRSLPLSDQSQRAISDLVDEALQVVSAPELFDRYIVFRLSSMLPGGRYPTPRHIVEFMRQLACVKTTDSVVDFACGSGGLLLGPTVGPQQKVAGVEISSEWARLAWTNCVLHGLRQIEMQVGNAVRHAMKDGQFANAAFDRVLMNPAFGEPMEPELIEEYFGGKVIANRSEAVLLHISLERLAAEGRAVVLLPPGVLSGNATSDRSARQEMMKGRTLEAVVALPKDAMQPYSPVQGHVVCIRNAHPVQDSVTWLFMADTDGYPAARARDYTRPPDPSDLDVVSGAIRLLAEWYQPNPEQSGCLLRSTLLNVDRHLSAIAIGGFTPEVLVTSIQFFPEGAKGLPPALLVAAENLLTKARFQIEVAISSGDQRLVGSYEEYQTERNKKEGRLRTSTAAVRALYPEGSSSVAAAVVSVDGRLLGIAAPQQLLADGSRDLRPERHMRFFEESLAQRSPAALLVDIKSSQKRVLDRIDSLLGRIEQVPVSSGRFPPAVWPDLDQVRTILEDFSEVQVAVWQAVLKKQHEVSDQAGTYSTPVPFTAADLRSEPLVANNRMVDGTLKILEQLGLIVPVTIVPDSGPSSYVYRLSTERDKWANERLLHEGD